MNRDSQTSGLASGIPPRAYGWYDTQDEVDSFWAETRISSPAQVALISIRNAVYVYDTYPFGIAESESDVWLEQAVRFTRRAAHEANEYLGREEE